MPKLSALTAKAAPTTADEIIITDKADSNNTKRSTINNLPLSAAAVSALAAKAALAGADFTGDVTTTGNLGVGTSSPNHRAHLHNTVATDSAIQMTNVTTGISGTDGLIIGLDSVGNSYVRNRENTPLIFYTNNTESMRLDASGNLLVGKTAINNSVGGVELATQGTIACTRDNDIPAFFNRLSTDGELIRFQKNTTALGSISVSGPQLQVNGNNSLGLQTGGTTRATIDGSGNLLVGKTVTTLTVEGTTLTDKGRAYFSCDSSAPLLLNRISNDGELVGFHQGGTKEGTISVSGTTVSYNGGHLARWSRMLDGTKPENLLKGTVMTNLDDMIEWAYDETPEVLWAAGDGLPEGVSVGDVKVEGVEATYWGELGEAIPEFAGDVKLGDVKTEAVEEVLWTETDGLPEGVSIGDVKVEYKAAGVEDNEQLNHTAISSVEGDRDVAGVFIAWDDDDEYNDYHLAMVGDVIIRIAEGVEVKRGDLLVSAGDGTAKPQDDDIQRSSTVAKVTSTVVSCVYDDGSFCVPCVLK